MIEFKYYARIVNPDKISLKNSNPALHYKPGWTQQNAYARCEKEI